jgi:hypothetical protein
VQKVRQSIKPQNGIENWQLLCEIAGRIGSRFRTKYKSAAEITEEICPAVPIYAGLDPKVGDAVCDIGKLPLVPVAPSAEALLPKAAAGKQPRATLAFDHLERRF